MVNGKIVEEWTLGITSACSDSWACYRRLGPKQEEIQTSY